MPVLKRGLATQDYEPYSQLRKKQKWRQYGWDFVQKTYGAVKLIVQSGES